MSRWPVTGPSEYWLIASSPASKLKKNSNLPEEINSTLLRSVGGWLFFFVWHKRATSCLGRLIVDVSGSHTVRQTHTHPVGRPWTIDPPVADAATLHNTRQTQETNIQALSGIRTGDLKRPQAYALYRTTTEFGRLIITRGVNQEDLQCISINPVEISTVICYSVRIYDLDIRRSAVEGDLFQFFRMSFFFIRK